MRVAAAWAGFSISALCQRLGMSERKLRYRLNGEAAWEPYELIAIEQVTGVRAGWLSDPDLDELRPVEDGALSRLLELATASDEKLDQLLGAQAESQPALHVDDEKAAPRRPRSEGNPGRPGSLGRAAGGGMPPPEQA